jgi:uncharacterized protein YndB with AHSA1/START domain
MAQYRLVTFWRLEAALQEVYDAVVASLNWPLWWHGAERVEERDAGNADGIGSVRRYIWKSRLAYRLSFDARTTRIEPQSEIEAIVSGDLEGKGLWRFSHDAGITTVCYEWHVRTTSLWMNLIAPVARSVFEKNHHSLMQNGAEGLARLLKVRLIGVSHNTLPIESDA